MVELPPDGPACGRPCETTRTVCRGDRPHPAAAGGLPFDANLVEKALANVHRIVGSLPATLVRPEEGEADWRALPVVDRDVHILEAERRRG
jgi:hypothetical protein